MGLFSKKKEQAGMVAQMTGALPWRAAVRLPL
jgi:hypothetical protein